MFSLFNVLPDDIKFIIMSHTTNKVYNLCFINKFFNTHIIKLRFKTLNTYEYSKLTSDILNSLVNLTYLNLENNKTITDAGIKGLVNLTELNLDNNEIITNFGILYLINLTS
ncbi:unnamed protein product, partial [marine sediment metagenome]